MTRLHRIFRKEIQSWISFIYAPLLAYIWCLSLLLSSLQTEDLMCFWCWSSHFWFCELSLCVQQNAFPTWRPLCLFCALFLILKIRLLVVIQCFPVPSECTCTSLCLLGRSHLQNACTLCLAMQSHYHKICLLHYYFMLMFGFQTSKYWFCCN